MASVSLQGAFTTKVKSRGTQTSTNKPSRTKKSLHYTLCVKAMTSFTTSASAVDHVVLIQVKEGTPSDKTEAMVSAIRSLSGLPMVRQLSVSALTNFTVSDKNSEETVLKFTHAVHGRYSDKQALAEYYPHPEHMGVVKDHVLPIMSEILIFDWEAVPYGGDNSTGSPSYGALRVQLLKPKADLDEAGKLELTEVMKGYRDAFPCVDEVSVGDNFALETGKGFTLGFMMLFRGVKEMEELNDSEEHGMIQKVKVLPFVESSLVFQYVVDPPYPPHP